MFGSLFPAHAARIRVNGTTTVMATYASTSGSAAAAAAAATVSAGCAGDDHDREKDRFVYCIRNPTLSL
jgi:hypothetical protein